MNGGQSARYREYPRNFAEPIIEIRSQAPAGRPPFSEFYSRHSFVIFHESKNWQYMQFAIYQR
jgi:hypothetical protein